MTRIIALLALTLAALGAQAELVLRQDTASQTVLIGPFLDATDGNTAVTELTIDATDVRISINGANIAGKNSGGCVHDELGYYTCTFDATDTATVGRMQVMVHKSGALPVYHEFQVVEEAVYDACCAADAAPLTASAVWTNGTRTITALDEDDMTLDIDAAIRAAVGLSSANLDTQISAIDTKVDDIEIAVGALNDLADTDLRDLVIEDQGEGGVTLGCAISVILAYAAGDLSTSEGTSTYEDPSGSETRITGTVSSPGNRTASITCPSY